MHTPNTSFSFSCPPDKQIQQLIAQNYHKFRKSLDLSYRSGLCWKVLSYRPQHKHIQIQKQIYKQKQKQKQKQKDWSKLSSLFMNFCGVNDENISLLAEMKWDNLETLVLNYNPKITSKGIEIFVRNEWPKLKCLQIGHYDQSSQIDDKALHLILNLRKQNWQHLTLRKCKISAEGLRPMLNFNKMELRTLILDENQIGNYGIKILFKANMPYLNELWVAKCQIGNQGFKYLSKSAWPVLKCLIINANPVSQDAIQAFQLSQWAKISQISIVNKNTIFFNSSVLMNVKLARFCIGQTKTTLRWRIIKTRFYR